MADDAGTGVDCRLRCGKYELDGIARFTLSGHLDLEDLPGLSAYIRHANITFLRTKNVKARRIPISRTLAALLDEQPSFTPWVFTNPRTGRRYSSVASSFKRAPERAKITTGDVTVHTLRHTALSQMTEAGYDDYTVMAISGHSSTRMLARYTHPTEARKQEALESFSVVTNWSQSPSGADPGGSTLDAEVTASIGLYPDFPKSTNTLYLYILRAKLSVRPAQVGYIRFPKEHKYPISLYFTG